MRTSQSAAVSGTNIIKNIGSGSSPVLHSTARALGSNNFSGMRPSHVAAVSGTNFIENIGSGSSQSHGGSIQLGAGATNFSSEGPSQSAAVSGTHIEHIGSGSQVLHNPTNALMSEMRTVAHMAAPHSEILRRLVLEGRCDPALALNFIHGRCGVRTPPPQPRPRPRADVRPPRPVSRPPLRPRGPEPAPIRFVRGPANP